LDLERLPMNEIAHRLNDAGVRPPGDDGRFYGALVERTLRNPINKGVMGYGKHSMARYATLVDGLPRAITGDGTFRRKSRDQWVESPVLFEGPVTAEEWEAAVEKLEAARRGPRVGRKPELILSGSCWCSHCGKLLSGWCAEGRSPRLSYACTTYTKLGRHSPCGPDRIPQATLLDVHRPLAGRDGPSNWSPASRKGAEVAALFPADAEAGREIRRSMAGILRAMEDYLFTALADILPFEELDGGRRRFTLERHDEPLIVLDLPGCDCPTALQDVYGWAASAGRRQAAESIKSLEATHDRLLRKWDELPTHPPRQAQGGRADVRGGGRARPAPGRGPRPGWPVAGPVPRIARRPRPGQAGGEGVGGRRPAEAIAGVAEPDRAGRMHVR